MWCHRCPDRKEGRKVRSLYAQATIRVADRTTKPVRRGSRWCPGVGHSGLAVSPGERMAAPQAACISASAWR